MAELALNIDWQKYQTAIDKSHFISLEGRVVKVVGLIVEGQGLGLSIGGLCAIHNDQGRSITAEVVGFKGDRVLLMPYGDTKGIRAGSRISVVDRSPHVKCSDAFLGRVVDGLGQPLDGKGPIVADKSYPLYGTPINPLDRRPIKQLLDVGVSAINTMITIGQGQRIAIMAGSGVGKSVLIGMMTKHTKADIAVIGLIGERGREVKDFISDNLGERGIQKSVVVAATSDSPPLIRIRGAYLATTIAEYFRDQGKNVLLILDSITRFAMSSRDVGLAAGEPPTNRGYTPSFFAQIPVLLERAGSVMGKGSITGIYTVLVEGDDLNDPVGDTVRSIVDGHIVLSRKLANRGQYPAIDVLESVSRVMRDVITPEHNKLKSKAMDVLSAYREAEDMIMIGAYADGSDPKIDYAKKVVPGINAILNQAIEDNVTYEASVSKLQHVLKV